MWGLTLIYLEWRWPVRLYELIIGSFRVYAAIPGDKYSVQLYLPDANLWSQRATTVMSRGVVEPGRIELTGRARSQ